MFCIIVYSPINLKILRIIGKVNENILKYTDGWIEDVIIKNI